MIKKLFLFIFIIQGIFSFVSAQSCGAFFNYDIIDLRVEFKDSSYTSSTSAITSYNWSFGDNSSSTGATNPSHKYKKPGRYGVRLTISDRAGCTDTFIDTVQVFDPPCNADLSYSIDSFNIVSFQNLSYSSIDFAYLWEFGDGDSSFFSDPTHDYGSPNSYGVKLTAFGNSDTCSFYDTIYVNYCTASFSHSIDTTTVAFTNLSGSSDKTLYTWTFGDGDSSNQVNPSHTYPQNGLYTACLTVFDSISSCSNTFCDTVIINIPPPCSAAFSYQIKSDTVFFQSRASNFTSLVYYFGDGDSSNQINPFHIYQTSKIYKVCQTVIDTITYCTTTYCDSFIVTVPPPCRAGFTYSMVGDSVLFESTANNSSRVLYYFGDGDSSELDNPYHLYENSNDYIVTQFVFDDNRNCVDSFTDTISVSISSSCFATYSVAIDTSRRKLLYLINFSSDHPTHNYTWNFGDGNIADGRTADNRYTDYGKYEICVTVSDTVLGCISTYCDSVGLDSSNNVLKANGFRLQIIDGKPIGIEENDPFKTLNLYPNPVRETLTIIKPRTTATISFQLYDLNKRIIKSGDIYTDDYQINMRNLKNGLYILQFFDGRNTVVKRLIKQ